MSMAAIFRLSCCQRLIVSGRYCGNEMGTPGLAKCPNGCKIPVMPNGSPGRAHLTFVEYRDEQLAGIPHVHGYVLPVRNSP